MTEKRKFQFCLFTLSVFMCGMSFQKVDSFLPKLIMFVIAAANCWTLIASVEVLINLEKEKEGFRVMEEIMNLIKENENIGLK